MEVPLNIIHNYIGFPVLVGLGIDGFRRYKKSRNSTSLLFAWATFLGGLACFSFGVPALFTDQSKTLSYGTFIGDILLAISFMFLWIICIRGFFIKRPKYVAFFASLVALLMLAVFIEAIHRDLFVKNSTVLVRENGELAIKYIQTTAYNILNGLHSLSLVLIAVFLWWQGKSAPDRGQKIRIRSITIGFLFTAAAFIVTPTFAIADQAKISVTLISTGMLIIGFANLIGPIISKRQKIDQPNLDQNNSK